MSRSRLVLLFVVLLCLVCMGGRCRRKKKTIIIPLRWELLSNPGSPLALDETDAQGDDLGYGSTADLMEMYGTYDENYVYFHIDVYSTPDIDQTGDIWYIIDIDANGNYIIDAGDYTLVWNTAAGGAGAYDYQGNPVSIHGGGRVDPNGGIDLAIGRSLVHQTSFELYAGILVETGGPMPVPGDAMPDGAAWATFTF